MSASIEEAIVRLRAGEIIAYPTETFFGLAIDPTQHHAVEALSLLKTRSLEQGISLIIESSAWVERFIEPEDLKVKARRLELQNKLWPGPLTLVISANELAQRQFHPLVFGPGQSLAVRVSSSGVASQLASGINGAITATSANPHGLAPASTAQEVEQYFPGILVLDTTASDLIFHKPSTIIDVRQIPFRNLREGAILLQ